MDSEAHKAFWLEENPKYFLKHSTTFSRGKLPLLYKQVKNAVDSKIHREMVHTTGVAFTRDHWSSRSLDPYLGVTMHLIGKNWDMLR